MINVTDLFDKFGKMPAKDRQFENLKNPLHKRPDICAFLLLDKLVSGTKDMVAAASHDQIWLEITGDELAEVASEDDIYMLVCCGVWLYDGMLTMFV